MTYCTECGTKCVSVPKQWTKYDSITGERLFKNVCGNHYCPLCETHTYTQGSLFRRSKCVICGYKQPMFGDD